MRSMRFFASLLTYHAGDRAKEQLTSSQAGNCKFCGREASASLMHVVTCAALLPEQRKALEHKARMYGSWEFTRFLFSGHSRFLQERLRFAADVYNAVCA